MSTYTFRELVAAMEDYGVSKQRTIQGLRHLDLGGDYFSEANIQALRDVQSELSLFIEPRLPRGYQRSERPRISQLPRIPDGETVTREQLVERLREDAKLWSQSLDEQRVARIIAEQGIGAICSQSDLSTLRQSYFFGSN